MFYSKKLQERYRNLGSARSKFLVIVGVVGIIALVVVAAYLNVSESDPTRLSARCVESKRLNDCGWSDPAADDNARYPGEQSSSGSGLENAEVGREAQRASGSFGVAADNESVLGARFKSKEKTGLQRVVHYVTTREPEAARTAVVDYSGEWSNTSRFGVAKVSIPAGHNASRDLPSGFEYLQGGNENSDPVERYAIREIGELTRSDFYAQLQSKERPLLFIHGFGVTFEEAILKTAMLAYDLKRQGPTISFSWPSHGELSHYPADLVNNKRSVPQFTRFLAELNTREIDLIVHGMGIELFAEALKQGGGYANFNQVILAAPDVDKQVFETEIAPAISDLLPNGVTLYASNADKFLLAAERIYWRAPRLGYIDDGITVLRGMDSVDISAIEGGWLASLGLSDFTYGDVLISDMYAILEHGHKPEMRVHARPSADGRHWVLSK